MEFTLPKRVDYAGAGHGPEVEIIGVKPLAPGSPMRSLSCAACVALGMALNSLQIMLLNAQFDAISIFGSLRSSDGT
jgi:hypothetical protein